MLRSTIQKAAKVTKRCVHVGNPPKQATAAKPAAQQNLLEVYIDDKKVLVEPGTTVLQVFTVKSSIKIVLINNVVFL